MPDAAPPSSFQHLYELRNTVDELIEEALVKRWSVSEVMGAIMPRVAPLLRVSGIFFETYGEDLELHLYAWRDAATGAPPLAIPKKDEVWTATAEGTPGRTTIDTESGVVVAQRLDVAGAWFGRAGVIAPKDADVARLTAGLDAVCEVLDNHLFSIRAAREKHALTMRLGNALRHRVLPEGLKQAVAILNEAIAIDRMVLVYVAEETTSAGHGKNLHVQLFEGSELKVDTLATKGQTLAPIKELGRKYLRGESDELLAQLGVKDAQEEVLINGITKSVVVGKVVVTSKHDGFNTYDRELLAAFAGFIRQRVVDFNKEWRSLAFTFRPDDVARLLNSDDYEKNYLAPREATVAIVYVDIAGFTKLSEQVLKEPSKVARLVEAWSQDAVDIVWQHGGVFDKMVGDCIIALFGPPFYDETPGARLEAAIRCAQEIRAMTNKLPMRIEFENLREHGVAVSTGVHLAPLFVGQFGPDSNFTGFSSGMNNTARLQGCATKNEILVMEEAIAALPEGHGFQFGEQRSMPVKNVAEPLKFRALVG